MHILEYATSVLSDLKTLLLSQGFHVGNQTVEEYLSTMGYFVEDGYTAPPLLGHEVPPQDIPPWEDYVDAGIDCELDVIDTGYDMDVGVPLTEDQIVAFGKIVEWVGTATTSAFALRGAAGTGKTTLLRLLHKNRRKLQQNFGIPLLSYTAPSNKAVQVIIDSLGVEASTIFSTLCLKMDFEEDERKLIETGAEPNLLRNQILVIDEAGATSKDVLEPLMRAIERYNLRVILVGDPFQWTPVGEKRSKLWTLCNDKQWRAYLKTVVRFDSAILALATEIRGMISDKDTSELPYVVEKFADGKDVIVISGVIQTMKELIKEPADANNVRALAYHNKVCDKINAAVRKHLGYTERWHPGEICCVAAPILKDGNVIHFIDEEGLIMSVVPGVETLPNNIEVDVIVLTVKFRTRLSTLTVLTNESSEDACEEYASRLAGKAKAIRDKAARRKAWQDFWAFKERFHTVRYPYAMTSHRLQGSTYPTVVVDKRDLLTIKDPIDRARAMYVGCTRPSTKLYIT